jgi:hypothetical protein
MPCEALRSGGWAKVHEGARSGLHEPGEIGAVAPEKE